MAIGISIYKGTGKNDLYTPEGERIDLSDRKDINKISKIVIDHLKNLGFFKKNSA